MSLLAALDATRICARDSAALADPAAWLLAPPPAPRREAPEAQRGYSWWALARNPSALLVTGLVGGLAARDAALRAVRPTS